MSWIYFILKSWRDNIEKTLSRLDLGVSNDGVRNVGGYCPFSKEQDRNHLYEADDILKYVLYLTMRL